MGSVAFMQASALHRGFYPLMPGVTCAIPDPYRRYCIANWREIRRDSVRFIEEEN